MPLVAAATSDATTTTVDTDAELVTSKTKAASDNNDTKNWSDEAEFSFVDTSGNTDVTTLALKNKLGYRFTDKLRGRWLLNGLLGQTDGIQTAERYETQLRLDYGFTKRLYGFASSIWLRDSFAGIDPRYSNGLGSGYAFLTGPKHFLIGELGVEYVKEYYIVEDNETYTEGRLFSEYSYKFTGKNKFSQTLEYLSDFSDADNYRVNTVTSISAAVIDMLSIKISYERKYNHQPVSETLDNIDSTLSAALVVTF